MAKINNQIFSSYQRNPALYDEIYDNDGNVKQVYKKLFDLYGEHSIKDYASLNVKARSSFFNQGITFQVYSKKKSQEKIFPFDLFPRIIDSEEWDFIERGAI
ncbi:MAG: circularly permuted type 2 ATP-grasp protein, partial [Eudoraea sp.]